LSRRGRFGSPLPGARGRRFAGALPGRTGRGRFRGRRRPVAHRGDRRAGDQPEGGIPLRKHIEPGAPRGPGLHDLGGGV